MPRHAKKAKHTRIQYSAQKTGWEPLPLELKIIFAFATLGLAITFFYIETIFNTGINIFGLNLFGINAALVTVVLGWMGLGLLLYGIWYRENWTWQYGMGYFGLIIVLNRILAMPSAAAQTEAVGVATANFAYTGWVIGILVNAALIYLLYKNKDYFNQSRGFRF